VSSTIGLRKPEAEAYDYVFRAIGVSADRIVFFDDSLENIEGAQARGLLAVHVKSGADLADALAVLIERSRAVEERLRLIASYASSCAASSVTAERRSRARQIHHQRSSDDRGRLK
jgi:FMN phosphatase YigB (HAD superfamily)